MIINIHGGPEAQYRPVYLGRSNYFINELGCAMLTLHRVLSLKVGEVVRLPTALDDAIAVRVAGVRKFNAVPVASRGQVAIEIRGRHED